MPFFPSQAVICLPLLKPVPFFKLNRGYYINLLVLLLLYPISDENNSDLWEFSPLKSTEAGNAQFMIKDREMWSWPDHLDMTEW